MKNIALILTLLFTFTFILTGCQEPLEVTDDTQANQNTETAEGEENPAVDEQQLSVWLSEPGTLKVAVSIPPLKYFVEQIGGNQVEVISLLDETEEFLTASPVPEKMAILAEADVFFMIGAPFETQIKVPATVKRIDIREAVKLQTYSSHATYLNGVKDNKKDPFFWLSPAKVVQSSSEIYLTLRNITTGDKEDIRTNYTRMVRNLNSLEGDVQRLLIDSKEATVYTDYPVLGYYADTFEIKQAVFDSTLENNINRLARTAIKDNVHTIFFGPFLPSGIKDNLENIINGEVAAINPLLEDYPGNLLGIAETIKRGTKKSQITHKF